MIFFLLCGLSLPRFDDFMYYFKTSEAGFTQFTYSLLTLMGAIALLFGIEIYKRFFMFTEPRKIITIALLTAMTASFFDILFILRLNLSFGIPDLAWVIFTTTSLGTMLVAMIALPPNVLFAKLTPAHVESTMMAFTGSCTAAIFPLSKLMAIIINSLTFNV